MNPGQMHPIRLPGSAELVAILTNDAGTGKVPRLHVIDHVALLVRRVQTQRALVVAIGLANYVIGDLYIYSLITICII